MENFVAGFMALMNFNTILFMLIGTVAGLIIGALPGLTGNMAIALMVPVTFTMEPTAAIAFLVAIYCSSDFRRLDFRDSAGYSRHNILLCDNA